MRKSGWTVTVLGVAAVAAAGYWFTRPKAEAPQFRTAAVERGDVVSSVSATGTLSAVTTVKVGSQVSGIIAAIHADFNSVVRTGQLLAELDPTPFQASVDQRKADLERARAESRRAQLAWARQQRLHEAQIASQDEYDTALAGQEQAAAAVKQAEAALRQAEVNLANTRITSPIDGMVVDRQYDVGQTVAASFQAPTLFTIAQDLTRMQVLANVDEADIGGVKVLQPASFTVDAYPDRTFAGEVSQVRLSPVTVQNVVTYPVVIDVPNDELKLRPGMTANVQIPVDERRGVLRVPNSALRFQPDPALVVDASKPQGASGAAGPSDGQGGRRGGASGPFGGERRNGEGSGGRLGPRRGSVVYVPAPGGRLEAVTVKTSITDGAFTALEGEAPAEGTRVVTGLATTRAMPGTGPMSSPMGPPGGGMRPRT